MIREEYKRAFLDEKNKKVVMIKFTETDEIIDASQIMDQGSFKYVDSSNDGSEIKLGFSESASFEIDVKGDWVEKSSAEIYVEVTAYEEDTPYSIPIGYFAISDVDYDYSLDKSHILAYSKMLIDQDDEKIAPPRVPTNAYRLNNYYLNLVVDGLIPEQYIYKTESMKLRKTIDNGNYYTANTVWTMEYVSSGTFRYYVSEDILLYRACLYHFDEQYSRMINRIPYVFLEVLAEDYPTIPYRISEAAGGYDYLRDVFWKQNPKYNPDNFSYSYKYNSTFNKEPYLYTLGSSRNGLWIPIFKDSYSQYDYKLSHVGGANEPEYARCYERSGYRYMTYTSSSSTDWKRPFADDLSDVNWVTVLPTIEDTDFFDDCSVKYVVSHQYGDISEFGGKDISETTKLDFASDLAESNGDMLKMDRTNGGFTQYSLYSDDYLLPSESLYPGDDVYPSGDKNIFHINKSMYSSLISKTKQSKRIGRVVVNKSGTEYIAEVEDFDEEYYSSIRIDNNNLIDNDYIDAQLVANNILNKYKDNIYTPFELECTGLPWLEAGDWIIVDTDDGQQKLNVNRRTLSGIQGMMDSLSAGGI